MAKIIRKMTNLQKLMKLRKILKLQIYIIKLKVIYLMNQEKEMKMIVYY